MTKGCRPHHGGSGRHASRDSSQPSIDGTEPVGPIAYVQYGMAIQAKVACPEPVITPAHDLSSPIHGLKRIGIGEESWLF